MTYTSEIDTLKNIQKWSFFPISINNRYLGQPKSYNYLHSHVVYFNLL